MTSKAIDFYFDFGSPTAYLAYTQLPKIAADANAVLNYKPVLLGGIFQSAQNASPMMIPAKGAYMMQDLQRYARRYQVPLTFNPNFPINTLKLMRLTTGVQQHYPQLFEQFLAVIFKAFWVDAQNLGDDAVIRQVLQDKQLDADAILALAEQADVKERLKQNTQQANARGLFGVPTMFVGDQMFWGQDRLDFVVEALQAVPA